MLKQRLLEQLAPREEKLEILGIPVVVREIPESEDGSVFADATDSLYKFIVRCTFDEEGKLAFCDEEGRPDDKIIPALKASGKTKLAPLIRAIGRVNGWEVEEEEKKSGAGPSSG